MMDHLDAVADDVGLRYIWMPSRCRAAVVAEILAERERVSAVLRDAIVAATMPASDRDFCIAMLRHALQAINPAEGKIGIPEINAEIEECAVVAETWPQWNGRKGYDAEEYAAEDIAAKIRSRKRY